MIKDSIEKLEEIFTEYITVESISEKLEAKSGGEEVRDVKKFMDNKGYDIVGINDSGSGLINGYIERSNLKNGKCEEYKKDFQVEEIVSSDTPLADMLSVLKNKKRVFVLSKNSVSGVVTHADLQKQPIRLFIFGFISLLEMHLLELIRKYFRNKDWETKLSKKRLKDAKKLYKKREKVNEEIDLASCLQLSDKIEIIGKNKELLLKLDFKSRREWKKQFKSKSMKIEDIRNNLAHSQELEEDFEPSEIIEIKDKLKNIIERCKKLQSLKEQKNDCC